MSNLLCDIFYPFSFYKQLDFDYRLQMGEEYREYLKGKYSELFILCERRLLYQSMIDNMGFDRKILFEKIFCDKKLSEDV